ncbi:MAG: disulfide bond formation protein B [Rhodospirillaceae bacterium]|nr:disulfide bond formation protein B [Rhodospirillaceae bacterium]|tara:strand:+ start:29928 stop:30443 length:516 start_codon:yes stop_codon:yes gene_type:complete
MNALSTSPLFSHKYALSIAALSAAGLLITVFLMQYWGGMAPCSLCVTQRWPHGVALVLGIVAILPITAPPLRRILLAAIAIAFAITAGIGGYHAGVEYGWFAGPTACSGTISSDTVEDLKRQLMAQPVIRCDEVAWSLFGISLAGYNFLISIALAIFCAISSLAGAERGRR